MNTLTGITLIRNGTTLNYPWKQCINSMITYCDKVLVNYDYGDGNDNNDMWNIYDTSSNSEVLDVIQIPWNMSNTGDGRELADQANNLLSYVETPWVLYLQADEFLLEKDGLLLKNYLTTLPREVTQVELFRTYFWENLQTRVPEHELWLGRVFRKGTHVVGGDGMYLNRYDGEVVRYDTNIYHYSRMGTEEEITKRWRNLDSLFHEKELVTTFGKFKYKEFRYKKMPYSGPHPEGVKEFYNG